jgi:hypothetical protein
VLTRTRSCSGFVVVSSEAGRAARDDEASTSCVCKESDAVSLRGGGGELGNLKP